MTTEPKQYWHKRRLPHFEGGSIPQGVTFRLADSLPRLKLEQLQSEVALLPVETVKDTYRHKINLLLDQGHGSLWLNNPLVAELVQNALLFFDKERYDLHAWVIMPSHVHALFTPLDDWTLTKIMHSWKSFSAREANKVLNRTGEFWQAEYFDRAIRDDKGFNAAIEYIGYNPVKAGLCETPQEWRFSSAFNLGA